MAAKRRVAVVERPVVRRGPLRRFALTIGVVFLVLALLENMVGSLQVGGATFFQSSTMMNALHWITGLAMLAVFFAGERAAGLGARILGVAYAVITVADLVFRGYSGTYVGLGTEAPWAYTILHGATAVAALFVGFRTYGTYAATTRRHAV